MREALAKWVWRPVRAVAWGLWNFSSARYVWRKFYPDEPGVRAPSSLLIWLVGIYFALFGFASQRHENLRDRLETRVTVIASLAAGPNHKGAISMIPATQNELIYPSPSLWPPTLYDSLFTEEPDKRTREILIRLVEARRDDLAGASLSGAYLVNANLFGANLVGAVLSATARLKPRSRASRVRSWAGVMRAMGLDHREWFGPRDSTSFDPAGTSADLTGANLSYADLRNADLRGVILTRTDLFGAICDEHTKWPEGFDPPKCEVNEQHEPPPAERQ